MPIMLCAGGLGRAAFISDLEPRRFKPVPLRQQLLSSSKSSTLLCAGARECGLEQVHTKTGALHVSLLARIAKFCGSRVGPMILRAAGLYNFLALPKAHHSLDVFLSSDSFFVTTAILPDIRQQSLDLFGGPDAMKSVAHHRRAWPGQAMQASSLLRAASSETRNVATPPAHTPPASPRPDTTSCYPQDLNSRP